jgi:integrase
MALTDTFVKNSKHSGKPAGDKYADGGGMYLLVNAGGRYWRMDYRFLGKRKTLALGIYPEVSLAKARQRRDAAREQLADGIDPSEAKRADKAAKKAAALNTFQAVAEAWLAKSADGWDKGTHEKVLASLVNHAFPRIGHMPINSVRPGDVRELVQKVEAAGARETAGRVFQRIRAVYRYAVAHELAAADPTYPLKPAEILKPQTVKHRAALSEREVPQFFARLGDYQGDGITRAALELLMLTAVRPGELRGAKWEEIDTERALWRIPAERMKMKTEHTVPLSGRALAILAELRPSADARGLVLPSPFYPGKPISDGTLNSALARMGYKGAATAHGFRTLFSTCANEAGWASDVIEKQLAHEERDGVRAAYNRASWLPERTKLMAWWAEHLAKVAKGADVIQLRSA